MAVMIDIPGIGTVEAKGAASEATLRELVKAVSGKSGGGPAGGGAGGAADTKGPNLLGAAFFALGKGVGAVTGVLGTMSSGVKAAAGAATGLAEAGMGAVDAMSRLDGSASGVAAIFGGIPLLGKAFAAVAGAADDVVKSYTAVSQSGASFGGSIANFSRAASEAGMSMDQFGALVSKNSGAMTAFGTTTEGGAQNFAKVSKALRATSSDLYALGFSTDEINGGLARYGALLKQQGLQGKQSNAELAAGAKSYLKEIDALAKATGQSREQVESAMAAMAKDAQFQASMSGLGEGVRKSFLAVTTGLPEGLGNFAKDIMATGTATTEENQKLMAMMPQSAAMLQRMNAKMQRGEAVTMEERNALNNLMKEEGGKNLKNMKYAGAANAELAGTVNALNATQQINANGIKEATEEQKKAKENSDKFNEKMQGMQQRIAEVSNTFKGLLASSGILDVMMKAFEFVSKVAMEYLVPAFNIITSIVMKVGDGISRVLAPVFDYLSEKFGAKGLGGTVEFINTLMNTVFTAVGGAVRGAILAFDGLFEGIQPVMGALGRLWESLFGVSDSTSSFGDILIDVGAFVGSTLSVLGDVIGFLIDYSIRPLAWTIKTFMIDPIIGIGKVIGSVISFFYNFQDSLAMVSDGLGKMIDGILVALPNAMGGISKEEKERRDAVRQAAADEREAGKAKILTAKQHKEGLKADTKAFSEKKVTHEQLTGAAKKEAEAKEKAVKAQEKANSIDYSSGPEELLKQMATKEGSALVPKTANAEPTAQKSQSAGKAEGAKKEIEADSEKKKQDEAKAKTDADTKAKEEAEKAKAASGEKPKTQESAESLLAQLNTHMAQLLKYTAQNTTNTYEQIMATKSLSKDLYKG